MQRTTLHFVGGTSRSRAEQARVAFALGYHAEVYSDPDELLDRAPSEGIVIAAEEGDEPAAQNLLRRLGQAGVSLPVVMASSDPALEQVVAAIKAGALDYLSLPLEMGTFARRLTMILRDADQHAQRRRREIDAKRAIGRLSPRERQVLELLSSGCSNKEIAKTLGLSPRTVEIHRGNMMAKLNAGHAADAVRLWIDAQLDSPMLALDDESASPSRIPELLGARRASEWPVEFPSRRTLKS